jgi:hypothetical protein
MTVSVFRDTWDVPHPSFLALHHLGADGDIDPAQPEAAAPRPPALDRHVAIRPRDTEHLREVIALTLADMYGQTPERDSDGDIVLRGPDGFIYLSRDEAGVLRDGQNVPLRVTPYPLFLLNDPYPTPESFDERAFRLLELLNPGDVICEIR